MSFLLYGTSDHLGIQIGPSKVEPGERTVQEPSAVFIQSSHCRRGREWPCHRDEAHSAVFVSILMKGHTRKMMAEMMPAEALHFAVTWQLFTTTKRSRENMAKGRRETHTGRCTVTLTRDDDTWRYLGWPALAELQI